jgi:hypothetical protein
MTGRDVFEDTLRAFQYCVDRADQAKRPEEREQLLLLAQAFRRMAANDATKLAFEMPKRPPVPSVKRRRGAKRRSA